MKFFRRFLTFIIIIVVLFSLFLYQSINNQYTFDESLIDEVSAQVSSYTKSQVAGYTKIDDIPENLKNAIIAVEDKRFYEHKGFDVIGIFRAAVSDLKEGRIIQGGSTITQQLSKNLFLTHEKSMLRKVKELILSMKLEKMFSKDEILEMYLNVIYYGSGAYGIQDASLIYFNMDVTDLNLAQCAMLAGLPQAPSLYNPKVNLEMAKERQEDVLQTMYVNQYISQDMMDKAVEEQIHIEK